MQQFSLRMVATWVSGCEDPGGKADHMRNNKTEHFVRIEASTLEEGTQKALREVEDFWNSLPKRYVGSLFWQDKDPELAVEFAQILPFSWKSVVQETQTGEIS